jgi:hypothetical protein
LSQFTVEKYVAGKAFEWNLEWLCVLLNEADVMASASAKYGPELGQSLAQEWLLIDFPLHSSVASLEGRKNFLKQLIFSSPSSLVLGLGERISDDQFVNSPRWAAQIFGCPTSMASTSSCTANASWAVASLCGWPLSQRLTSLNWRCKALLRGSSLDQSTASCHALPSERQSW